MKHKAITIHSDSQASLDALDKETINSKTVLTCIEALNLLGSNNDLDLKWIKAHVGNPGNETADSLAKMGTTLGNGTIEGICDPVVNQKTTLKNSTPGDGTSNGTNTLKHEKHRNGSQKQTNTNLRRSYYWIEHY